MRDALIFILVLGMAGIGYVAFSQNSALKDHERQIHELTAKLESRTKTEGLGLQAECAKQAAVAYKLSGFEKEQMAGYENHYNEKLNKCFIIVERTQVQAKPHAIITSKYLSDAFEGKNFGNYFWQSDGKKKYWEVAPFECDVTIPSGEKKVCHSSEEFVELLKVYMQ